MKKLVEKIQAEIDAFVVNAGAQVVKGNKAAGARARKAALELMIRRRGQEVIFFRRKDTVGLPPDCIFLYICSRKNQNYDDPAPHNCPYLFNNKYI